MLFLQTQNQFTQQKSFSFSEMTPQTSSNTCSPISRRAAQGLFLDSVVFINEI